MTHQEYLCGGSGDLTPEARAELDAFADHLTNHKGQQVAGCRFCASRVARAVPDIEDGGCDICDDPDCYRNRPEEPER